ncbi:putative ribonuclease H domain-containing protein [Arabidopsis thaliana]
MAEVMAVFLAIQQAVALGYKKISLASDSQQLIKALNLETQSKELYGILHDILSLSSVFEFIRFSYVSRDFNRRADEVAKSALTSAFIVPAVVPVSISI